MQDDRVITERNGAWLRHLVVRVADRSIDQSVASFFSAAEGQQRGTLTLTALRSARRTTMAASVRTAATRILRPTVFPGEGLRRLANTQQLSKSTLALEGEHRPSAIQQREQLRLKLSKCTLPLEEKHRAELIEQKKEHLYELIADAHADSAASSRDTTLLKCEIIRTKKVTNLATSVAILATSGLTYCVLTAGPELARYDGHIVTAQSLPLLQGHWAAAPGKGVHMQDMQK